MAISRREFVGGCVGAAFIPTLANAKQAQANSKLKKISDKYSDIYGSPGIAISVAREGKTILSYAAGFRDLSRPNEITSKDQVAIGAISRVVCGYIAGQVVREKKLLDWDSDIAMICPDLCHGVNSAATSATLQQLLTHTAGLTYAIPNQDSVANLESAVKGREVLANLALTAPGVMKPSTKMAYASGSNLIAIMAEKVSNQTYEQLIAKHINEDLGLKSIRLGMDRYDEKSSSVPRGHYLNKENREFIGYGPYSAWGNHMRFTCDANIAVTGSPVEIAQLMSIIAGYGGAGDTSEIRKAAHTTPFPLSTYTQVGFSKSSLGLFHYGSTGLGEWASAYVLDSTKTAVFVYMNCNYQEGGFKATELVDELNELFGK